MLLLLLGDDMAGDWDFEGLTFNSVSKTFPDTSEVENPTENIKTTVTDKFLADLEEFVLENGLADNVAYADNIDGYCLNDFKTDYGSAIVFILKINQDVLDTPTGREAQDLNDKFYEQFGKNTYKISDYLRKNGYETYVSHPKDGDMDFSKLGEAAGLGAIGQSGLLISPENGPNQKISAILTNIENLPIKENQHQWIRDYCETCGGSCIKKCPENALVKENDRIELIDSKCLGCSEGCTDCITLCPFYKKGYGEVKRIFKKLNSR